MRQLLRQLRRRDEGEGLTEYALVIGLVAVGLIVVLHLARNAVGNTLGTAANNVERNSSSSYGASAPGTIAGGWGGGGGGGGGSGVGLPPADDGSDDDDGGRAATDSVPADPNDPTHGS